MREAEARLRANRPSFFVVNRDSMTTQVGIGGSAEEAQTVAELAQRVAGLEATMQSNLAEMQQQIMANFESLRQEIRSSSRS